jgi:ligand-binding sensor domain-containing protein/signal transduction histidine kinase
MQKPKGILIILCLIYGSVFAANKNQLDFIRADLDIHLPQSSVYSILQDRKGFLWFATREGVARWDGYKMRVLRNKPFSENSLPGNVVHKLIEDCQGNIWVWTQGDPYNRTSIARIKAPANIQVKRYAHKDAMLFRGKNCQLWLVDEDGFYRYDQDHDKFIKTIETNNKTRITTGLQLDSNKLLLGDDKGIITMCSIHQNHCQRINSDSDWPSGHGIITMYQTDNNQILVTAWQQGLAVINPDTRTIKRNSQISGELSHATIREIVKTADSGLLMITSIGVLTTDRQLSQFSRSQIRHENGTNNPDGNTIFVDATGAIWVGSMWGVYVADPFHKKFNHYGHNPIDDNSLSAGLVMAIHADDSNNLWVGSFGGGLNRINLKTGDIKRYPTTKQKPGYGTYSQIVWSIDHDSKGNLWIASESLNRLNIATGKIDIFKADPQNFINKTLLEHEAFTDTINDIYVDNNDLIWLATATGLFTFNNATEQFSENYLEEVGFIYNVTGAENDNLWVGSSHSGLIKFDPQHGIIKQYQYQADKKGSLSHNTVLFVYQDKLSNLWVGTYSGLNRLDEASDTFQLYTVEDGLPGAAIIYMLEAEDLDRKNETEIWLSTNRGLARLKIKDSDIQSIDVFDTSFGIKNTEFNRNSAALINNKFYFGGDRGITYFSPKNIVDNPYPPPIDIISAYQKDEKSQFKKRMNIHQPLVINASSSVFGFEFTSLSFSYPDQNQYQYQLKDFEKNWSQRSRQRQVHYPNVPPGKYVFSVRGANADGHWNETGIKLAVTVLPWFWETLWFQILMLTSLMIFIISAVVYIMRNKNNKQLEKIKYQQALLDERNRISQDMHDEIGASLSEIVILSQQHAITHNEHQDSFNKIAQCTRGVLESIGEIIWATNPRNDKLDTLLAYMREQAVSLLDSANIKANLIFPTTQHNTIISAEVRRNLYLIMKEAIINAIKHANASLISVHIDIQNNQLLMTIEDNGNGLLQQRKNGMGLKNMHKRSDTLKATLTIQSVKSRGCVVKLEYWHISDFSV